MYTLEKLENNKYKAILKVSKEDWEKFVNQAYEETKHKFNVQGFRKGKVPRKVIEQNYGAGVFYDDALEIAFRLEYSAMLKQETQIVPITDPEISIGKFDEEGVEIIVELQNMPEVKLGQYKNLEVKKAKGEVTEEQINAELEQGRERLARFIVVDRESKMGDFVTIDFIGSVDGKEFDGGKAEDYRLELGSHSFIDTFEDQLVGLKAGAKQTVKVKFPEDYPAEELKGKDAEFECTMNKVEEKQLPELNDEFASNVSEFETLEDYKADIKKNMQASLENQLDRENENKLLEAVVKNAEFNVPEVMITNQLEMMLKDFESRIAYQGLTLDKYFELAGGSVEEFNKVNREKAEEIAKTRVVLGEIVTQEKLAPTQEEIDAKIQEISSKYNKSLEDYKKSMSERELFYFENDILMEKLIKFLKENNKLVD